MLSILFFMESIFLFNNLSLYCTILYLQTNLNKTMLKIRNLLAIMFCVLYACTDDSVVQDNNDLNTVANTKSVTLKSSRKAPLYWSVYEACFTRRNIQGGDYIPESELKENIDWIADNLRDYGYTMVCMDGWGDVDYNEYGYRTRHSRHWTHNYAWWANYLKEKGMELGMYDNPLWVNRAAANADVKIKGTDIPLSSIMNVNEYPNGIFTWVQVDRPGAEEYVKGCIEHYAEMGVKFFRVDFLSWYETGMDKGNQVGYRNRPRAHYETALRWMREECDRHGMFLSLVMPNLTNDGELEAKYGDMIRINEDCDVGGWYRFSQFSRGIKYSGWSQYRNTMDGFAYFSKLSGRDKLILDGDFIRISSYDRNDDDTDEKKTVISMHLIAGGPISITDRKSTIRKNLWLYQNREMLALNEDGFVGKPLSNDPKSVNSQIWIGQMSDGDWVVGLFNREDTSQRRSIDFSTLGINGYASVRDLWEHKDLGEMDMFSVVLRPHASMVIRIKPSQNPMELPKPWMRENIGNVLHRGTAKYDQSTDQFLIDAAGADIEGTKDEFMFVYQQMSGDSEIIAKVNSMDHVNAWSKAGLMIRSSLNDNANNAMIAVTPSSGVSFQRRLTTSGGTTAQITSSVKAPVWLKLRREGNIFKAFYSVDNNSWHQVGSNVTISMPQDIYIGMAVTSHDVNKRLNAVFEDVSVKKYQSPLYPWIPKNIGSVKLEGNADYDINLNEYRISASGTDIEGTNDQFNFAYQEIDGDVTLTTQVTSLDNTNNWAKAGLMIRSSLNTNANNAMVTITPKMGTTFQHRKTNGGGTTAAVVSGQAVPIWLKIIRKGDLFTAYYSKDNSTWNQIGSPQTIYMSQKVYVGMAVTSHDNNKLCNAVFKNMKIE